MAKITINTAIVKRNLGRLTLQEDDFPDKDLKYGDVIEVTIRAKLTNIGDDYGSGDGMNAKKPRYEFDITEIKSDVAASREADESVNDLSPGKDYSTGKVVNGRRMAG